MNNLINNGDTINKLKDVVNSNTTNLSEHLTDTDSHITNEFRKKIESIEANASNVTSSSTNGNIVVNDKEVEVYRHPEGTNPHGTTKADVGLGKVDNTSDADKPISTAMQGALDTKANLDENGKILVSEIPDSVNNVIKGTINDTLTEFTVAGESSPVTGDTTKIYIDTTRNISYQWDGSKYVEIGSSLKLGESSNSAYAGDKGKALADSLDEHTKDSDIHITANERLQWNAAEENVQSDWSETDTASDAFIKNKPTSLPANGGDADTVDGKHASSFVLKTEIPTSLPASDVSDWAKAATKPTYTADEVGADAKGSADKALSDAKSYTDEEIAGLINGAPTTLDTLGEIANAMAENKNVVDALNEAIGTKATSTDLTSHTSNKSNPHGVTKAQVGLGNVDNTADMDKPVSTAVQSAISTHEGNATLHITSAERTKWNKAEQNVQSDWSVSDSSSDAFIKNKPASLPASDVSAWAKAATKPTYTASEVGADPAGSANTALENAKKYTDTEIAGIINGAPTTLDTLGEIADAMAENKTVVDALNDAIGSKANTTDLSAHTGNTSNPHNVTKSQVGLGNVPNVATNDQTPTFTESSSLTKLTSGEKLSVAFGKISKAVTDLISHVGDSVKHITSTERSVWDAASMHAGSVHAPSNAQANIIETIKVNGNALTPTNKSVDISVPVDILTVSGELTLTASGWSNNIQTVSVSVNTSRRNVIDIEPASLAVWAANGVYATTETSTGITFTCDTVPSTDLKFKISSFLIF